MRRVLFVAILLSIIIQSCSQTCSLNCSCFPTLAISGYRSYQLDTVIIKTFLPDSSFSSLVDTYTIRGPAQPWWEGINDTDKSQYLVFSYDIKGEYGYHLLDYITERKGGYYDFEVIIPFDKRVYKVRRLVLAGPATNEVKCKNGVIPSHTPCHGQQYISSYNLDGKEVDFPANSNTEYVYLNK